MACKLYLSKALKKKTKPKPINKGSGSLLEREALVTTREGVIMEASQEEVTFELALQEWGESGLWRRCRAGTLGQCESPGFYPYATTFKLCDLGQMAFHL